MAMAMSELVVSNSSFIAQVGDATKYVEPTSWSGDTFDPDWAGSLWSAPSADPYLTGTLRMPAWIMGGTSVAVDTAAGTPNPRREYQTCKHLSAHAPIAI
jgi:hypothetical protein